MISYTQRRKIFNDIDPSSNEGDQLIRGERGGGANFNVCT